MAENKDIDKQLAVVEGDITKEEADKPDYERVYQVYENTRVPVSKRVGPFWKSRWKEVKNKLKNNGTFDRWDEVIGYYQNDQGAMTDKRNRLSELGSGKSTSKKYLTENMVFANTSALVPATYTKNPDIEVTTENEAQEGKAKIYERLVDTLFARKQAPGINIKPRMKKTIVTTTLTNICYMELSYVLKENSSEQALKEIETLSKELSEAKTNTEIEEIEGKLQALEGKINLLAPSGPKIRVRMPDMVYADPAAEDGDPINGDYMFVGEYIRTNYLQAIYGRKNDKGEWMSIYKPTHVLKGDVDAQGHDEEINNFTLLTEGASEHENYGYKDKKEFDDNCRTLCWYLWDKTTRRCYLFNDSDWSWPIWVWDDPYKLSRFYPIFALTYTTDPKDMYGKSEVMYYLDQQDELNEINNERARMRHWAMSKIFVNSTHVKDATNIQRFLSDDTEELVFAIDLPEGVKWSDAIAAFPAPSTQFEGLFDSKPIIDSINRLSSVTPVLQNAQYKTNTTNKAIESYESSTQMRLDEKIDSIEEMLGDIGVALIEMCIQFMTADEVTSLLGEKFISTNGGWDEGISVAQFNQEYNFRIVGGSTLKPTSKVKKEQAANLGQILGQFANASPMVVLVLLKMLERAYGDDVSVTDEDWAMIIQSTEQQMQRGSSQPGAQGQPSAEGQPQAQGGGADPNAVMAQVEQIIDQLPPQAKEFLGAGIAKGVPLKQLVMKLTQAAQSQQQQRPQ